MMPDCKKMIHPFQTDPGTSQRQRLLEDLLSGPAKIDARTIADLLDFFVQLSRHVNYYDEQMVVSDWQPFFKKSLPFTIAAIMKYDRGATEKKLSGYKKRFERKPSAAGLQLLLSYTYNDIIKKINRWQLQMIESGLPIQTAMEQLIKDKLSGPVKEFISYANAGTKWYCTKNFNFSPLQANPVWMLTNSSLVAIDEGFQEGIATKRKRLVALYNKVFQLVQSFLDVIRIFSVSAEQSLEQSLLPLKEELKEKHPPHLAIIFAFLKLFQYLQDDLNTFTKKHLDFFYKRVLKLKPKEATPDKIHVVFEIQKQLEKYLLKKGLLLKDGKDNNKAEVYFSTDDEIVVNKTQVAEQRTLFLNHQPVRRSEKEGQESICNEKKAVEGVYMALDATKANGIDKDFKDVAVPSRAAFGARWSKYIDPENKFILPYANARLGFILASPVLLLNEGKREITITLDCELNADYCSTLIPEIGKNNSCCDSLGVTIDPATGRKQQTTAGKNDSDCVQNLLASDLYDAVNAVLGKEFYYLSQPLIAEAVKKGIGKSLLEKLQKLLTIRRIREEKFRENETDIKDPDICYCAKEEKLYETTIPAEKFKAEFAAELIILKDIFKPRKALSILFSGEKGWIAPMDNPLISVVPNPAPNPVPNPFSFTITITATLKAEEAAVTFYNAEVLKEDINTTLPVAKIELDDKIKLRIDSNTCEEKENKCCDRKLASGDQEVSLYYFFRTVKLLGGTKIDVKVCGFKNFVVQNDEGLQDVNKPVYPFGTRPEIIDFDVVNPRTGSKNLVGPNFLIGSKELFLKTWEKICINVNWKDKPTNFNEYYKAYIVRDPYFDCSDPTDATKHIFGLNECEYEVNFAILENGVWKKEKDNSPKATKNTITGDWNRKLFHKGACNNVCNNDKKFEYSFFIENNDFPDSRKFSDMQVDIVKYKSDSKNGFLRINLQNQDFLHKDYAFVLARQMMAFGKYPSLINEAIYEEGGIPSVFDISIFFGNIGPKVIQVATTVVNSAIADILNDLIVVVQNKIDDSSPNVALMNNVISKSKDLLSTIATLASITVANLFGGVFDAGASVPAGDLDSANDSVRAFFVDLFGLLKTDLAGVESELKTVIKDKFDGILATISLPSFFTSLFGEKQVLIPNEPWTPIISNISIDYTATTTQKDIDLIHLYPYAGTYKPEELELQPTLFPTFCDEGTLFIGMKDLKPGSNVNILFQLAEATADSESEREELIWYYLENNTWKLLRTGFEILNDDTNGLTTSGIIKFLLPANMTNENTILPKGLHWIKAAIPCKSRSVSEIIGVHTQAIKATFTNEVVNDKLRLAKPLAAGAVSKLKEADTSLKKINQLYDSFGGRVPETEGHFYIRASELLRHKNRTIQKFDYERLALEAFPQLFKVKCINHSYALDANKYINDFPVAPGYVLLAVIPDLNQLKAAKSFEPRVPVSLLEDIKKYLQKISSPFVRLWIKNPRYEKVNFCLRVKLLPGKDEVYYKERMAQDIREFLAPWAVGKYDKLTFGEPVNQSDIIRFLEARDYLDYIIDLRMIHADDEHDIKSVLGETQEIIPITPRSILIAGIIDVCIEQQDCEQWCPCKDANGQQNKPCCCDHKKIPVMDYCSELEQ